MTGTSCPVLAGMYLTHVWRWRTTIFNDCEIIPLRYRTMDTTTTAPSAPLRLTPELIETIRGCSFDGLKALPRRGAEVGGLITAAGSSLETAEELRLVRCEHLY